jgi:methyl-accepting chemotaxis protein
MHRLAQALADLARRQGVRIDCGHAVHRVLLQQGRVAGVQLQDADGRPGEHLPAAAVVFNGDAAALPAGLLGTLLGTALFSVLAVLGGLPLARRITRQLGGEPEQAHAVVQAIAQGDLTVDVPVNGGDDSSLMAAMKNLRDSLSRTVQQVRQSSDHIATSAGQIASGNADLSQRTESQASSLEQTAAAMEQLTSTVRQNSDTARQANQLASSASAAATKGGHVVGQVVATMEEITASSRKIGDIIG